MERPRLLLLGAPRVESNGTPLKLDTRKALALLAYLAVTQRRHTRDALVGLLWPEHSQTRARAALRRTLSSLGKARTEGWLDADRESVSLDLDETWVDVDRFHGLLSECRAHAHPEAEVCSDCLPPLSEAVTLYRDDFMAGFGLRDSAAFDDWQFFQAEGLRRELMGALDRLARGHAARGEWEPAIAHTRRRLTMDPLHEPAHCLLMELHAWSGQRATALRQYRECVRILGKELGVSPLEETTRLYHDIKENRPPTSPVFSDHQAPAPHGERRPACTPTVGRATDNPLVGRAVEWETLLRSYETSRNGGQIVVLEGEAGIGKTRLAEEFLAYASSQGATTVVARCYPGETSLAYGPFIEGLSAAVGQVGPGRLKDLPEHSLVEAARLLPGLLSLFPGLPPAPPLDAPGARSRFFEGIGRVLLAVCGGPHPGLLFLDDLQWADDASLDLLTYLVRRLRGRPLCIIAAWRDEDVPVDHRLRALVAEAERADRAAVLHLERLERSAVAELVSFATRESDGLDQRLYDETEGLPLFLMEYLTAITKGELDVGNDVWSPPGGVRDLLHGRLRVLSGTAGQLLATAAAIGRSFDFDTVREASGRGEEETIAALEELTSRKLIKEIPRDAHKDLPVYDFSHDKLRVLVYEETSLARRRLLHKRVAGALVACTQRRRETGSLASQIANHYQQAGYDAEAAEYFKLAGEHARALYANADALCHFQMALAMGHPDAIGLHEAIGDLKTLEGEYSAALASYEAAAALCEDQGSANIERKLGNVYQRRGDWDLADDHYRAALEDLGDEGPADERVKLYADRSLLLHNRGQTEEAAQSAHLALELAEAADDTRSLAQAHNMVGMLAKSSGDQATARRHLELSLTLAETFGHADANVAALNNLALACGSGGEAGEALKLAETALALCITYGDRHREAALHNNLADLLHAAGREEESMAHLQQAVEIFAEIGEEGALQPEIWKLAEW